MKQILAAIVLFIYFCATTGFVISMHYCMDRFDSAEIGFSKTDKCLKCGMHKKAGCCKDDVKVVKLQTFHVTPKTVTAYLDIPAVQTITTEFLLSPFQNYRQSVVSISHSPPLDEQETYLKNRVFRI
jgi:methionyl-tRNA synthetase